MSRSTMLWVKAIVYGAGMQGACSQEVSESVIKEAALLHETTENMIEYCLAQAMTISNQRGESKFSDNLINYLRT